MSVQRDKDGMPVGVPVPGGGTTIQIGGAPAWSKHVEQPNRSVEQTVASPETVVAQGDEINAQRNALAVQDRMVPLKVEAATQESNKADLLAKNELAKQQETLAAQEKHAKLVQAAVDAKDKKRQEAEAAGKITSFWDDRSAPSRVFSAFLTSLGDMGSQMAGGPTEGGATRALLREQDADSKAKIGRFERSKEFLTLAKQDVDAAKMARADEIERINHEHIIQANQIVAQADAYAKRSGIAKAQVEADALHAKTEEDNAKRRQEIYAHNDQKITAQGKKESRTDTSEKQPSEGAGRQFAYKAEQAKFGTQIKHLMDENKGEILSDEALQKIQNAEQSLESSAHTGVVGGLVTRLGREAEILPRSALQNLTPAEQKIANNRAIAEKKAATVLAGQGHANAEEMIAKLKWQPGESVDVKRQKDEELYSIAGSAIGLAGPDITAKAAGGAEKARAEMPPQAGKKREGAPETKQYNGKTYVKINGVWHTKD